ncbi:MAG: hypothetical protein R2734_11040 [Nocardioides sp.]
MPAPYVMMAATDSRRFTEICDVYQFAPFRIGKKGPACGHPLDERIGVEDFLDGAVAATG